MDFLSDPVISCWDKELSPSKSVLHSLAVTTQVKFLVLEESENCSRVPKFLTTPLMIDQDVLPATFKSPSLEVVWLENDLQMCFQLN